jgi:uncharacterized protein YqeY
MDTRQSLEVELRNAMRSGENLKKQTLRMVISAIKFAEIESRNPLDEPGIQAILQKEIKSRREAISDAERANRPGIVQTNLEEIAILNSFLPKQLDDAEITKMVIDVITQTQAKGISEMGKVMKLIIPKIQGRASSDRISQIVKQQLQG